MPRAEDYLIRQKLIKEWNSMISGLARLHSSVEVRPKGGDVVIPVPEDRDDDRVAVKVGPAVFKVPERGRHGTPNLFVYLMAELEFDRTEWAAGRELVTTDVKTQTAHFRLKKSLKAVHGAHYDYATDRFGHPFFHMQVHGKPTELSERGEVVRESFNLVEPVECGLSDLLPTVRSSSAQVDAFSFLLQIAADHLLPSDAPDDQQGLFRKLCELDSLCGPECRQSAAQPVPSVRPTAEYRCFRARHWYGEF